MLIVPPPAKKQIVDRTAGFVAKSGRHVEEEILNRPSQGKTASSFTFLLEDDPYHPYYLSKIEEFLKSGPPVAPPVVAAAPPPPPAVDATHDNDDTQNSAPVLANSLSSALKKSLLLKNVNPPPYEFFLERPYMTTKEQQLIQLTAQFAATDGKKFETDLQHYLKKTPSLVEDEFHFVFPTSPLHFYYCELVRCYKKILSQAELGSQGPLQWVLDLSHDKDVLLNRAVHRFEKRRLDASKSTLEETKQVERQAFLEIDWHDFVVVETVTMTRDTTTAATRRRHQDIDALVVEADAARRAVLNEEEEGEEAIEVRTDFTVEPTRQTKSVPLVTLMDGKRVPVTDMNQVMRTELQDGRKWREDQDKFEKRTKDTNLVEANMFKNLVNLAGARPDVFGGELSEAEAREEAKRRREGERIVWDGNLMTADTVKHAMATKYVSSIPHVPAGSLPLPPMLPSMPPVSEPKRVRLVEGEEEDVGGGEVEKVGEEQSMESGVLVSIPPLSGQNYPSSLRVELQPSDTVQQAKEKLSALLSNVALGKFQLKVVSDGRFLKNTELVSSFEGSALELKWKSR